MISFRNIVAYTQFGTCFDFSSDGRWGRTAGLNPLSLFPCNFFFSLAHFLIMSPIDFLVVVPCKNCWLFLNSPCCCFGIFQNCSVCFSPCFSPIFFGIFHRNSNRTAGNCANLCVCARARIFACFYCYCWFFFPACFNLFL